MKDTNIANDIKGLTLVELMVVMVLSLVLMGAVYMTYQVQKSTGDVQHEVATIQQDLRAAMDIMARDIRNAGCDPSLQAGAGIIPTSSGPSLLSITMDLNEDMALEQVDYEMNGTDLHRNDEVLVQNITSLQFTYRDVNNAIITPTDSGGSRLTATEADNVRYIDVTINVRSTKKDIDINDYINRTMTKRIKLRNQGI